MQGSLLIPLRRGVVLKAVFLVGPWDIPRGPQVKIIQMGGHGIRLGANQQDEFLDTGRKQGRKKAINKGRKVLVCSVRARVRRGLRVDHSRTCQGNTGAFDFRFPCRLNGMNQNVNVGSLSPKFLLFLRSPCGLLPHTNNGLMVLLPGFLSCQSLPALHLFVCHHTWALFNRINFLLNFSLYLSHLS